MDEEIGIGNKMMPESKVRYEGASTEQVNWGSNDDPRGLLTKGEAYTVSNREVHSFHTKLTLAEFPGKKFNSASFSEVTA